MPETIRRPLETAGFLAGVILAITPIIYLLAVGLHRFNLPTPAQAAAGMGPNG